MIREKEYIHDTFIKNVKENHIHLDGFARVIPWTSGIIIIRHFSTS